MSLGGANSNLRLNFLREWSNTQFVDSVDLLNIHESIEMWEQQQQTMSFILAAWKAWNLLENVTTAEFPMIVTPVTVRDPNNWETPNSFRLRGNPSTLTEESSLKP